MDATANNAITVLRNITILRQRYIAPNQDRALDMGIAWRIATGFDETVTQLSASHA
jgi:hypothetical protein